MTRSIIKAVQKADVRAVIAKGWSDRGGEVGKDGQPIVVEMPEDCCYSVSAPVLTFFVLSTPFDLTMFPASALQVAKVPHGARRHLLCFPFSSARTDLLFLAVNRLAFHPDRCSRSPWRSRNNRSLFVCVLKLSAVLSLLTCSLPLWQRSELVSYVHDPATSPFKRTPSSVCRA